MLFVILPSYNEENALPLLLQGLQDTLEGYIKYEVIVVDDGSTDSTAERAYDWRGKVPVKVIRHGENRGLGAAIQTGFSSLLPVLGKEDMIAIMDSDNTHDPVLIPKMIERMRGEDLDIVIASRFVDGGEEKGVSPYRKALSHGASFLLRRLYPIKGVRDFSCGYRLYSGLVIRRGYEHYRDRLVEERGFSCMVELLIKLGHLGGDVRVGEIPLALRYDLKVGKSKLKVIRTIYRYLIVMIRGRSWTKE